MQTNQVIGGVVGGVAGLSLLVALAFMLLRWKKRGVSHLRLGEDGRNPASRTLGPAPGPGGGSGTGNDNGAYGTMERSSPYVVPSALAALAGKRSPQRQIEPAPEMGERSFVRVSGKKLPPVLQFGGDGYTDPRDRESLTSDVSVYRDSMAVFNHENHTQLTLGSPMRPESGVMVMHPGPRKTPVTEQAPRPVDSPTLPRSNTFPLPTHEDALGRTLLSEDYSRAGSRGSGTRFTEDFK